MKKTKIQKWAIKESMDARYLLILGSILLSETSQAASIESIINRTTTYLQGGLARSLGVLLIVIAGFLCFKLQRFPKEYFFMVLVGLGMIFSASTLYSTLIG